MTRDPGAGLEAAFAPGGGGRARRRSRGFGEPIARLLDGGAGALSAIARLRPRRPDSRAVRRALTLAALLLLTGAAAASGAAVASAGAPAGEALAAASADLERGLALLLSSGGGPKALREAEGAFTAVITRLWPELRGLDGEARRLLASAFDHRGRVRLKGGRAQEADADFRLAVEVDPSYLPDPKETSAKSLERFERIRSACVAWVVFRSDAPGTRLEWNGRSLGEASTLPAETPVVAGWYLLRASAPCSEERRLEGSLEAGEKRTITIQLEPTGRDLLFTTRPAGFDIEVDGTAVGTSAPSPRAGAAEETPSGSPAGGEAAGGTVPSGSGVHEGPPGQEGLPPSPGSADSGSTPGVLLVPCLPAGDHRWSARRDCFEGARGSVPIVIDLLDRSPAAAPVIAPRRLEARLTVETDVPEARVLVDGAEEGAAPVRGLPLCPGRKRIEVRTEARLVWSSEVQLGEGPSILQANRRPTLRVLIAPGGEPGGVSAALTEAIAERAGQLETFNRAQGAGPSQDALLLEALGRAGGPGASRRPPLGADLVLAAGLAPRGGRPMLRLRLVSGSGVEDETWCDTEVAACLDAFFRGLEAPWPATASRTGLSIAAAPEGGLTVLAARGPAASAGLKAGDLLERANGFLLANVADIEKAIRGAAGGPVADDLRPKPGGGPAGAGRRSAPAGSSAPGNGARGEVSIALAVRRGERTIEVTLPIERALAVSPPGRSPIAAARLAAIAELEGALVPPGESGNAALLGLASTLIGRGDYEEALERALERPGLSGAPEGAVALGTARYLAGLANLALGRREQAFAAFRRAATDPGATLWDPDGLPVAPMARLALKALGTP